MLSAPVCNRHSCHDTLTLSALLIDRVYSIQEYSGHEDTIDLEFATAS